MNTDELNAAAQKLIEEANTESAAALALVRGGLPADALPPVGTGHLPLEHLSDALHELRADYDAQVLRIQKELDESLEALYGRSAGAGGTGRGRTGAGKSRAARAGRRGTGRRRAGRRGPGGEEPGGEEPGGEEPGGEEPDRRRAGCAVRGGRILCPCADRYIAVKNYYLSIPDAAEALELLRDDDVAKEYIGTYYNYLEQLLIMMQ